MLVEDTTQLTCFSFIIFLKDQGGSINVACNSQNLSKFSQNNSADLEWIWIWSDQDFSQDGGANLIYSIFYLKKPREIYEI